MNYRSTIGAVGCALLLAAGCNDATSDVNNDSNATTNNATTNNATTNNATTNNATTNNATTGNNAVTPPYEDCTVTLAPGETLEDNFNQVQSALFDAAEGDVICFVDGVYEFDQMLSLTNAGVELRGQTRDGAILDFSQQVDGANGIKVDADAFRIQSLTVRDTLGDGIRVTGADGVTFSDIRVEWTNGPSEDNGAYGIYPVQCNNVLVENSIVSAASDAGIYVGQSTNILVKDNEVFDNVAGIEIENSTDAEVVGNHAHDNTGGVLVFNLPNLPVMDGKRAKVHNNIIENNNTENFAGEGNIVGNVPTGTGILVLASDANEFTNNTIRGNASVGIAIVSYQTFIDNWDDENFDPYSQNNYTHGNTFENNGYEPKDQAAAIALASNVLQVEQMLWDGFQDETITDASDLNCFSENVDENGDPASYRNFDAAGGFANQTTELGAMDCMGTELPAIDL